MWSCSSVMPAEADLTEERDRDWQTLKQQAEMAPCVPVKATDPLYILYTSGDYR